MEIKPFTKTEIEGMHQQFDSLEVKEVKDVASLTFLNQKRWLATVDELNRQLKVEQDALQGMENYALDLECSIAGCREVHG
jgi:hypothetical protein